MKSSFIIVIAFLWAGSASGQPFCFEQAGARYGVSPVLLRVIAQKESGLQANAVQINRNGTRDIGLMQINSSWLPRLQRQGVSERDLYDPCTNTHIGAWILASNIRQLGPGWEALGAYNARSRHLRARYASDVILRLGRALGQR